MAISPEPIFENEMKTVFLHATNKNNERNQIEQNRMTGLSKSGEENVAFAQASEGRARMKHTRDKDESGGFRTSQSHLLRKLGIWRIRASWFNFTLDSLYNFCRLTEVNKYTLKRKQNVLVYYRFSYSLFIPQQQVV